jgi:hypothetical protein
MWSAVVFEPAVSGRSSGGRIVRTARRRLLKIDPAWPWTDVITTAHAHLTALPAP